MGKISSLSIFLMTLSFVGLLHNPITFGCLFLLSLILIFFEEHRKLKKILDILNNKILIFCFVSFCALLLISSFISIDPVRSLKVVIYLIFFIFVSFLIYQFLISNPERMIFFSKNYIYTIFFTILFIFIYNLFHTKIYYDESRFFNYFVDEVKTFKGVINIYTIMVCLLPLFELRIRKIPFISIISFCLIIPVIFTSNSNSSFLGMMISVICLGVFFLIKKFSKQENYVFIIYLAILFFILLTLKFFELLPEITDKDQINETVFKIHPGFLDVHRQFIWSFSLEQIKENFFLGIGPDTSNFIKGSQIDIGHNETGDMNFIPSHPHNFFIELLLEIGVLGTLAFCILIFVINTQFILRNSNTEYFYLVLFNSYFWGSSLVNFSFWNAWWQGSYFFLLAVIFSTLKSKKIKNH